MKINELPFELLMKIFSYLSTFKKVKLVSRRFYEVACEVNNKNVSLTLDHRLLHLANNTLQSLEESNLKISKVKIFLYRLTEEDFLTLLSIISRFSATIKYLRIEGGYIEMAFFIKILTLVPNAEHFSFQRLSLLHADKISSSEDLNLKHLRNLEIFSCEEQFQLVFNRLPSGVITELLLNGGYLLTLNAFFSRQTNIKKLSLEFCTNDAHVTAHILDNLELSSLNIKFTNIETAALSRQTKLKSLTLNGNPQDDQHLMEAVANTLTELEELNWNSETPADDFVNIGRLTNLKHLRLYSLFGRPEILDELIQLNNSRLVTLEISDFDDDLTNDQIETLATSAPKLKVLKIHVNLNGNQSAAVLKHFNFVECLSLYRIFLEENYENYLNQSESGNAKLTELSFSVWQYEAPVLRKMMADFPNLKKLKIVSLKDLISPNFRLIVDGFTKLESLDLCAFRCLLLTIDDFKYLRDNRKRLQTLLLRNVKVAYVDHHLRDLEAMFVVGKNSRRCRSLLLKM